jgi:acetone monooxygenase
MSPAAAYCNVPTCVQQQVDWITDCITFARGRGAKAVEPTREAQDAWVAHHDEVGNATLAMKTKSWHVRTDAQGNQQRLIAYAGGANRYRKLCDEVKEHGYKELTVA